MPSVVRGYVIRHARIFNPSCADVLSVLRGYVIRLARICHPPCGIFSIVMRGYLNRLARTCCSVLAANGIRLAADMPSVVAADYVISSCAVI
ncbi:hypothetical protein Tco_1227489 [Tanacetum coccineum]